jgi:hypothetical protein
MARASAHHAGAAPHGAAPTFADLFRPAIRCGAGRGAGGSAAATPARIAASERIAAPPAPTGGAVAHALHDGAAHVAHRRLVRPRRRTAAHGVAPGRVPGRRRTDGGAGGAAAVI